MKFLRAILITIFVLVSALSIMPLSSSAYRASQESVDAEIGKNVNGDEYLEDYGMSREAIVSWLSSHLEDDYYLGTPYVGEDWQSPNGDTSYNGAPGMNCAGMVAHMVRMAGLDAEKVMKAMCASNEGCYWGSGKPYDLLSGASNWYLLVQNTNIRCYYYDSFDEMFADGHAEMGDIVLLYVNKPFGIGDNEDNHLGIYWGETGTENAFWQEIGVGCVISEMHIIKARILLIKTSPEEGVSMKRSSEKVLIGDSITLEVSQKGAASDAITWSSGDDDIAEVSDKGVVKASALGTVAIRASSGEYYDECSVTVTGPDAPSFSVGLIAANKARITWKAMDGVSGYKIYRSNDSNCLGSLIADITSDNATSFIDSDLLADTKYFYTVKSYVKIGDTAYMSNSYPQKSIVTKPSHSLVYGKLNNDGSLVLSWKAVDGYEWYDVYWSTDGISYSLLDSVDDLSVQFTGFDEGKTYYFMIKPFTYIGTKAKYAESIRSFTYCHIGN